MKTILVGGHGPGISEAVARRFGREDFAVALVARNKERIEKAAGELAKAGITAKAFAGDLGDVDAVRALVRDVKGSLGPIHVVHWNAYTAGAGDVTTAPIGELRSVLDTTLFGLVAATQEALPDLEQNKGALLVTGGGFAYYNAPTDDFTVSANAMGLAIGKAAQHKATGLLHQKLAPRGVYVGEVVVLGLVKGTAWDNGQAKLDPADIADKFWELYTQRKERTVDFG